MFNNYTMPATRENVEKMLEERFNQDEWEFEGMGEEAAMIRQFVREERDKWHKYFPDAKTSYYFLLGCAFFSGMQSQSGKVHHFLDDDD